MQFSIGEEVEAVDMLGIWSKAKIVDSINNNFLVTFPPWPRNLWDREIADLSEIRPLSSQILVPRGSLAKKNPNIKKLTRGDILYLDGEEVTVELSDPIKNKVTIITATDVQKTVDIWKLEKDPPFICPVPNKRRKYSSKVSSKEDEGVVLEDPPATKTPLPSASITPVNEGLQYCIYMTTNGISVQVGHLYNLKLAPETVFICTHIVKEESEFKFTFLLCTANQRVESVNSDFQCTVSELYIHNSCTCMQVTPQFSNVANKIVSDGWDRVLHCQVSNSGNVAYLQDLRRNCLAGQIRHGVLAGISRTATRPAQPIHLGVFDPMHDSKIFGLSCSNNFQVTYFGKDVGKLDGFLGKLWDVKVLESGNPYSHFKYVCKVKFFVHKPSMGLRCSFFYSESDHPFSKDYRSSCTY